MTNKPYLCLDFDGVVHAYTSRWQGPTVAADPPVDGFFDFLREAQDANYRVAIHSSRSHQEGGIDTMRAYLWRWGRMLLPEDEYWRIDAIEFPTYKPPCMLTLDDRAWTFRGVWPHISELKQFRPWNKET